MKKKYFLNANIVDPHNSIEEIGGLIINEEGKIEAVASRVDPQTRSILARAKINNEEADIIPGSLLEIEIFYNEKKALSVPDTSIMYEGSKKFIYKITEDNMIKKTEIETGVRIMVNLDVYVTHVQKRKHE